MRVHKNIGNVDLAIRIFILALALYLGFRVSPWFYLFVIWELFIVSTRWCFVYDLLNIDTLGKNKSKGGVK